MYKPATKHSQRMGRKQDIMNKVILIGRLTKDAELLKPTGADVMTRFCVAVRRRFAKENKTDFINCVAWEKTAEFIYKYFKKGDMIGICGSLRVEKYEKDGETRYNTCVNAEDAYFCGGKVSGSAKADEVKFDEFRFGEMAECDDLPF